MFSNMLLFWNLLKSSSESFCLSFQFFQKLLRGFFKNFLHDCFDKFSKSSSENSSNCTSRYLSKRSSFQKFHRQFFQKFSREFYQVLSGFFLKVPTEINQESFFKNYSSTSSWILFIALETLPEVSRECLPSSYVNSIKYFFQSFVWKFFHKLLSPREFSQMFLEEFFQHFLLKFFQNGFW